MSEGFKERLEKEQDELQGKVVKLDMFINTKPYHALSFEMQRLLNIQLSAMKTYDECLTARLELLNN